MDVKSAFLNEDLKEEVYVPNRRVLSLSAKKAES
jgi:hypothetical protein